MKFDLRTFFATLFLSLLLGVPVLGGPAHAQQAASTDSEDVMLVLDASGSMWGQVDGTNKVVIAREVIAELMANWDAGTRLGLTAYGHRRKGDCTDIEMLVPVGPDNANRITEIVGGLNPKGKTPLSASVQQAAEALKYTENKATVILVTDGLETCNADPCALATQLEQTGVDFTTHVVGFDISAEESEKLQCIASNTGGQYFSADNAAELATALDEVVEVVSVRTGGDRFFVRLSETAEPEKEGDMSFRFYQGDEEQGYAYGPGGRKDLPPGNYDVVAKWGAASARQSVEFLADETRDHVFTLNAGTLGLTAKLDNSSEQLEALISWRAHRVADDGTVAEDHTDYVANSSAFFVLPEGTYRISAQTGDVRAAITHEVVAGNRDNRVIDLRAAKMALSAVLTEGGPKATGLFGWRLYPIAEDGTVAENSVAYAAGEAVSFTVAAGDYMIQARMSAIDFRERITLQPGDDITHVSDLQGGTITFDATLDRDGPRAEGLFGWRIYPMNADGKREDSIEYAAGSAGRFMVPAGKYQLEVSTSAFPRYGNITVRPGSEIKRTINLDAGRLNTIVIDDDGENIQGLFGWRAFPVKKDGSLGDSVDYQAGAEGNFLLRAREYEIHVRNNGTLKKRVTIEAGKTHQLIIEGEENF